MSLVHLLEIDETKLRKDDSYRWLVEDAKELYKDPFAIGNFHCFDLFTGNNYYLALEIYNWIVQRIVYEKNGKKRDLKSAEDVYIDKKGNCSEMALLYIAFARQEGLYANYASVYEDFSGRKVEHACATIRVRKPLDKYEIEKVDILVDPAYKIFDARHKKIKVLTDEEVKKMFFKRQHQSIKELKRFHNGLLY